MTDITFRLVSTDEADVLADGEYVGGLYRQDDILNRGVVFYVLHLSEDPRGPVRVHERNRVREVARHLLDTHPML
jgi:hypothetical protein